MKKNYYIFASSFFFNVGMNILSFSLIYRLVDRFAFNPGQIGFFIGLGMLFFFLGCNLYHRFGSAFDPAKVYPVSVLLIFLASIPLGLARTQGLAYVSFWMIHLNAGFFWPPIMAWLTGGLGAEELNRELGHFNRSCMAGNIFGPLISGTLYQWNSTVSFFAANFSFFLVLVLLYLMGCYSHYKSVFRGFSRSFRRKEKEEPAAGPAAAAFVPGSGAGTQVSQVLDKRLDLYRYRGWINVLCASLFVGFLANIIPLHIRDGLGYTERAAGMMLFLRCVAAFIGFTVLARLSSWHFKRRWFIFLHGAIMLCVLLFLPAGNHLSVFFIVVFLYGLVHAGCYNNSIFYSGATGNNPKKNMAVHEIFIALGLAAGSAGGGLIFQHFHFIGTCIALFLVLSLCLGLLVLLDRKEISHSRSKDGA